MRCTRSHQYAPPLPGYAWRPLALLSIIGSETIASLAGLGHRIVHLAEGMEMARMFAYIAFVVAIAAILNALVSSLEARGRRSR